MAEAQVNYIQILNHYATKNNERFKDDYTGSEGPQITRTYTCRITLLDKVGVGTAKSKKEAKVLAAKNYLEQVMDVDKLVSGSPSPSGSPSADRTYSVPLTSTNHKANLQEFLQKNQFKLPEYRPIGKKGPSHNLTFTIKCIVRDHDDVVIKEVYGNGKSKKEAEQDAACNMKPLIEDILSRKETDLPVSSPPSVNILDKPAPPVDPVEFDELLSRLMSLDCEMPEFLSETVTSDMGTEYLCLASTKPINARRVAETCHYDVASHPIVAHGMGSTEEEAKYEALCNLMYNVQALGIS